MSTARTTPATTRPPRKLVLPEGMLGVRLEMVPSTDTRRSLVLGGFRLARAIDAEPRQPLHRSLGLIVDIEQSPHLFTPFADVVLLPDDETLYPAWVEGSFMVDLAMLIDAPAAGMHMTVFAVMQLHVSNVLDLS